MDGSLKIPSSQLRRTADYSHATLGIIAKDIEIYLCPFLWHYLRSELWRELLLYRGLWHHLKMLALVDHRVLLHLRRPELLLLRLVKLRICLLLIRLLTIRLRPVIIDLRVICLVIHNYY